MSAVRIAILSQALALPAQRRSLAELAGEEQCELTPGLAAELGVEQVAVCSVEKPSDLALAAAQAALAQAGVAAESIDVIVDYGNLPQELLVPAWNMSNKVQAGLGAKRSFTIGFSGHGATNFLVALEYAVCAL